ncbi:MAG TPA: tyrosine-type recombinase/integrase [Microthrixaceae bacterium]|jgi:integrase/recombinase XerD|nr:tyrosine-type recombinase/integrase [Microthrixaceae bacterium]HMT24237.1 tyrosine-type recombinase/integrase [Microthrixaceae bacterium]
MTALTVAATEYLALRRRLGHDLADAHRLLPRFVAYLDDIGAATVTVEAAIAWSMAPEANPASSVWPRRMIVARGFARHMTGIDPATEVPPVGLIPAKQRWRPPFLFTAGDIERLVSAASSPVRWRLPAATHSTLIGLLAVTGMRVGEALKLDDDDIDWDDGVVLVRESKFGKSRFVPLDHSTVDALRSFVATRDGLVERRVTALFVSIRGNRMIYKCVQETFRRLCDTTGIGADAPNRPRVHDLRHSFAVNTLIGWHRNGENVDARLPALSTYLGHRDPRSTYWYLSAAPELLALAARRIEPGTVEP